MTRLIIYVLSTDRLSAVAGHLWACGGAPGCVCRHPRRVLLPAWWAPVPAAGVGTRTRPGTPLQPLLCPLGAPRRRGRTLGSKQCQSECTVVDIAMMPQVGGAVGEAIDGASAGAVGEAIDGAVDGASDGASDRAIDRAVDGAAHCRTVNLRRTGEPPSESSHR